ncbi:hypothetical protein FAD45_09450 [Escherichia coli]|nr:hypothetical protein [Escherichia coli]
MMSLWDALRMNMMISYQELVRTFPSRFIFSWHPFYTSVSACFFRCTNRTIITDKFAACRTV